MCCDVMRLICPLLSPTYPQLTLKIQHLIGMKTISVKMDGIRKIKCGTFFLSSTIWVAARVLYINPWWKISACHLQYINSKTTGAVFQTTNLKDRIFRKKWFESWTLTIAHLQWLDICSGLALVVWPDISIVSDPLFLAGSISLDQFIFSQVP